jgi:hypothetical protein
MLALVFVPVVVELDLYLQLLVHKFFMLAVAVVAVMFILPTPMRMVQGVLVGLVVAVMEVVLAVVTITFQILQLLTVKVDNQILVVGVVAEDQVDQYLVLLEQEALAL